MSMNQANTRCKREPKTTRLRIRPFHWAACLLPLSLMLSISVTGCSLNPSKSPSPSGDGRTRPEIQIVISNLGMTFPEGMDENDNRYLSYIEEQTGLDIQVNTPPPKSMMRNWMSSCPRGISPTCCMPMNPYGSTIMSSKGRSFRWTI